MNRDQYAESVALTVKLVWYSKVLAHAARVIGDRADDDIELNHLATECRDASASAATLAHKQTGGRE